MQKMKHNKIKVLSKCKKEILISMIWIILISAISISIPMLTKLILEIIENQENTILFLIYGLLALSIVYVIQIFINIKWNISLDKFGGKFIDELSTICIKKLVQSRQDEVEKIGLNKIKGILFHDILDYFRIVGGFIPVMISSFVILLFCFVISLTINWQLTIILVGSIVIGVILSIISRNRLSQVGKTTNTSLKNMNSNHIDFVDSMIEIKINQLEAGAIEKSHTHINDFVVKAKKEDKRTVFWSGLIENYNSIITIAISFLIAFATSDGVINHLIFYTILTNLMITNALKIERNLHQIFKLKGSIDNVKLLVSLESRPGELKIEEINSIAFHDVSFSYPNTPVFEHQTITIQKGDIVKIQGENGSGKTTLLKLILNLYRTTSGIVLVNDININEINYQQFLSRVLFLGQDEKIPNGTLFQYLMMCSKKNLDRNEVREYMDQIGLELDENACIENNGLKLSPGQRKKILLLKMLVCLEARDFVILDEVAAGLDQNAKEWLYQFLNKKRHDKIFLVINHEHDTIQYNQVISL